MGDALDKMSEQSRKRSKMLEENRVGWEFPTFGQTKSGRESTVGFFEKVAHLWTKGKVRKSIIFKNCLLKTPIKLFKN